MAHVLYALFPSRAQAEAAVAEVVDRGVPAEHLGVVLHQDQVREAEELAIAETDAREGLVDGALIGGLTGLLAMGVLVAPVGGLVGAGALASAALGLVAGGTYGALAAGLAGLGVPDRSIEPLLDRIGGGRVLVTTQVRHDDDEALVEGVFARHGALEERKHVAL